jgi:hypothetical protein
VSYQITSNKWNCRLFHSHANRINNVMASVLVSSAVDRGFEPQSGQKTKDYKIGICCFSAKHATLMSKSKYWLTGNQCVRVEQHVYTRTVSASYPYKKSNSAWWSSTFTDIIIILSKWNLGTVVPLEIEKYILFIYSLTMKPIYIFEVRKLDPFIYYSVISDSFIYWTKFKINTHIYHVKL